MSAESTDKALDEVPEVSVLTSWTVAPHNCLQQGDPPAPLGLKLALREGIGLYDLYFLHHQDIPWYAAMAGVTRPDRGPQLFASKLSVRNIEKTADALRNLVTDDKVYGGKLVGRRPRFAACATFFPLISSDDDKSRRIAVRALRRTLLLAAELGMSCVEVVGGAGVPEFSVKTDKNGKPVKRKRSELRPDEYREMRMGLLATSIQELFDFSSRVDNRAVVNALKALWVEKRLPYIAMEIEPGPTFLINELPAFRRLRDCVKSDDVAQDRLCLNIDIAHAFLTNYSPADIRKAPSENNGNSENIMEYVGHIHLSDHGGDWNSGGMHAADLRPGVYHFYDTTPDDPSFSDLERRASEIGSTVPDDPSSGDPELSYCGWLKLAAELMQLGPETKRLFRRYSGAIGIELEACHDINEVLAAINITRQWLRRASDDVARYGELRVPTPAKREPMKPDTSTANTPGRSGCAILVIDIGNSTKYFGEKPADLDNLLKVLCREVLRAGGSLMSYTGDGFIALFEEGHFRERWKAAAKAVEAAKQVCSLLLRNAEKDITVRAALHWGQVHIPTSGPLRDQVMGPAVICAARLCDFLGHRLEPAIPRHRLSKLIGSTEDFLVQLRRDSGTIDPSRTDRLPDHIMLAGVRWDVWGEPEFKGLLKAPRVYTVVDTSVRK